MLRISSNFRRGGGGYGDRFGVTEPVMMLISIDSLTYEVSAEVAFAAGR